MKRILNFLFPSRNRQAAWRMSAPIQPRRPKNSNMPPRGAGVDEIIANITAAAEMRDTAFLGDWPWVLVDRIEQLEAGIRMEIFELRGLADKMRRSGNIDACEYILYRAEMRCKILKGKS